MSQPHDRANTKRGSVVSERRCSFTGGFDANETILEDVAENQRTLVVAVQDTDALRCVMSWYNENLRRPGDEIVVFCTVPRRLMPMRTLNMAPVVASSGAIASPHSCARLNRAATHASGVFEEERSEMVRKYGVKVRVTTEATRKEPLAKLVDYIRSEQSGTTDGDAIQLVVIGASEPEKKVKNTVLQGCAPRLRKTAGSAAMCRLVKHCSVPIVTVPHPTTIANRKKRSFDDNDGAPEYAENLDKLG